MNITEDLYGNVVEKMVLCHQRLNEGANGREDHGNDFSRWREEAISRTKLDELKGQCLWLVNLTPPTYPVRNKGLIASLIKGRQWLISHDMWGRLNL